MKTLNFNGKEYFTLRDFLKYSRSKGGFGTYSRFHVLRKAGRIPEDMLETKLGNNQLFISKDNANFLIRTYKKER